MSHQDTIQERIETKLIFKHWILEFFHIVLEIFENSFLGEHFRVFLHLSHDLGKDYQSFSDMVRIKAYFQLFVVVFLGVFDDVIEYFSHHFADDLKRSF